MLLILIQFTFTLFHHRVYSQGLNNLWYQGYSSWAGLPYGGIEINFATGAPVINYVSRPMDLSRTHANISDSLGNMLFYTNGYYIADASNDTMLNGSSIGPSSVNSIYPPGLPVPQACLIIPKPENPNLYYLFHSTLDNPPAYNKAHYLYLSVIDMNGNGGLGSVIIKNQVLLQDTLNAGKITAIKHANGRDWWVVCHRFNSNKYYKFLISVTGVSAPSAQNIGTIRSMVDIGQVAFSPDGNRFAYFNAFYTTTATLDIYDFDRCSGSFSNPHSILIPQSNGFGGGLCFSPNSKFLYVCNVDSLYQYDLTAPNIEASKFIVAAWDSFYSPNPPFATLFENAAIAADGKIYITTGNGTFHMHVINNPDSLGAACDLVQHGITLPAFYFNSLPNHPNYFLGCDTTSCQCLTTDIPELPDIIQLKTYPNPTNGPVTFQFPVQGNVGEFSVYDVNGKLVHKENIAPWSQFKKLDLTNLGKGIYFCKLRWKDKEGATKIILE